MSLYEVAISYTYEFYINQSTLARLRRPATALKGLFTPKQMFSKEILLSLYDQINPKKVAEGCSFNKLMFFCNSASSGHVAKKKKKNDWLASLQYDGKVFELFTINK